MHQHHYRFLSHRQRLWQLTAQRQKEYQEVLPQSLVLTEGLFTHLYPVQDQCLPAR